MTDEMCPRSPTGEHDPLCSDEGGPVFCRHCQTQLRYRGPGMGRPVTGGRAR